MYKNFMKVDNVCNFYTYCYIDFSFKILFWFYIHVMSLTCIQILVKPSLCSLIQIKLLILIKMSNI